MATQHVDIVVTPTITSGSAYASGNQIGGLMTLTGVNVAGAEGSVLQKITIVDASGQSAAIDVLLFNAAPAVGSDKTAVSISASDMAAKCIGNIKIPTTQYSLAGTPSVAAYTAPNMPFYAKPANLTPPVGTLYAVAVSRGTPTYTSTTALTFRFHFSWDT